MEDNRQEDADDQNDERPQAAQRHVGDDDDQEQDDDEYDTVTLVEGNMDQWRLGRLLRSAWLLCGARRCAGAVHFRLRRSWFQANQCKRPGAAPRHSLSRPPIAAADYNPLAAGPRRC